MFDKITMDDIATFTAVMNHAALQEDVETTLALWETLEEYLEPYGTLEEILGCDGDHPQEILDLMEDHDVCGHPTQIVYLYHIAGFLPVLGEEEEGWKPQSLAGLPLDHAVDALGLHGSDGKTIGQLLKDVTTIVHKKAKGEDKTALSLAA